MESMFPDGRFIVNRKQIKRPTNFFSLAIERTDPLDLLFLHSIPYMRIDGFQIKEKKMNHCAICKRLSTTIFK
jgi:hypothetical protein